MSDVNKEESIFNEAVKIESRGGAKARRKGKNEHPIANKEQGMSKEGGRVGRRKLRVFSF